MKRDSKKLKNRVSSKNLQKLTESFANDAKYMATSSYSESLTTSELSMKHVKKTSLDLVHPNSSKSEITRPKNPIQTISSTLYNNEVMVFDVNGTGVLHSLMTRGGAWFLDVSDFDAMDKNRNFQYLAMRPSPRANLILTRVPELRHLIYVAFDDEGRPYPIQMREVAKANYLTLDKENEETAMGHSKAPSLWESLSVTLRRTVMFNEGPHAEERIEGLQNNP